MFAVLTGSMIRVTLAEKTFNRASSVWPELADIPARKLYRLQADLASCAKLEMHARDILLHTDIWKSLQKIRRSAVYPGAPDAS